MHFQIVTIQEIKIGEEITMSVQDQNLLCVIIDHKLDIYVDNLYKKANRILHALARVICLSKTPAFKHVLKSQFNYCSVVRMFRSWALNSKINKIYEECLRIIYSDKHSRSSELLKQDRSVSIHNQNF